MDEEGEEEEGGDGYMSFEEAEAEVAEIAIEGVKSLGGEGGRGFCYLYFWRGGVGEEEKREKAKAKDGLICPLLSVSASHVLSPL